MPRIRGLCYLALEDWRWACCWDNREAVGGKKMGCHKNFPLAPQFFKLVAQPPEIRSGRFPHRLIEIGSRVVPGEPVPITVFGAHARFLDIKLIKEAGKIWSVLLKIEAVKARPVEVCDEGAV